MGDDVLVLLNQITLDETSSGFVQPLKSYFMKIKGLGYIEFKVPLIGFVFISYLILFCRIFEYIFF